MALALARGAVLRWATAAAVAILGLGFPALAAAASIPESSNDASPSGQPFAIVAGLKLAPFSVSEFFNGITANAGPRGIAAGPDDNVWFSEERIDRIGRITPTGTVTELGGFARHGAGAPPSGITPGSGPFGIAAGADGGLWFTEPAGDRIGRISTQGVVNQFSSGISANSAPNGITAGPCASTIISLTQGCPVGSLWFTEAAGNRIGEITTTGFVREFSAGLSPRSLPLGITHGPDGNLWFTEFAGNRIGRITRTGVITQFSAGISPNSGPDGITAGPDGNLWFTEQKGNRIGRITPQGIVTEFSTGISPNTGPTEITTGPDGELWFTEAAGRIGEIAPRDIVTSNGTITEGTVGEAPTPTAASDPEGIAAGPGGMWFTEHAANKIGFIPVATIQIPERVLPSAWKLTAAGPTNKGAILRPVLQKPRLIGLVVYKLPKRTLVGLVPLGHHSGSRQRVRWNLEVDGRTLPNGTYEADLKVFSAAGKPTNIPGPRPEYLVVSHGRARVTT